MAVFLQALGRYHLTLTQAVSGFSARLRGILRTPSEARCCHHHKRYAVFNIPRIRAFEKASSTPNDDDKVYIRIDRIEAIDPDEKNKACMYITMFSGTIHHVRVNPNDLRTDLLAWINDCINAP